MQGTVTQTSAFLKLKGSITKIVGLTLLVLLNDQGFAQAPKNEERPRPNILDQIKEKAGEVVDKTFGNPPNNSALAAYVPTIGEKTPCGNGDFENGLSNAEWQGAYGTVPGSGIINFPGLTNGIVPGTGTASPSVPTTRHLRVLTGNDPNGLPQTAQGTPCGPSKYAVRIGQLHAGSGVDLLSKTFVVTPAQSNISFWYSVVLQNPGSNMPYAQRPSFWVRVSVGGVPINGLVDIGGTVDPAKLVADSTNTVFQQIPGQAGSPSLLYKRWSCAWINLSQHIGQTVTVEFVTADSAPTPLVGRYAYAYLDNYCSTCCPQTPPPPTTSKFCCPGKNLVTNGDFEQGNTGFSSQYFHNSILTPFATVPGKYSVVTGNQALGISPLWAANDHSTCVGNAGKFLVVNGRTTQPLGTTRIIWQQTVTVKKNTDYRFCVNVKNLPQATFDIKPKIQVRFTPAVTAPISGTINWPVPACNWQLLSANLSTGNVTSLTIQIELDEAGLGDGNDLAIDDISLQEKQQLPACFVDLTVATSNNNGTTYNVTANYPTCVPPAGITSGQYGYVWGVCELDNVGNCWPNNTVSNPSTWWTYPAPNTFNGYTGVSGNLTPGSPPPLGLFETGRRYRITYAMWSDCESLRVATWELSFNKSSRAVQVNKVQPRVQDMEAVRTQMHSPVPLTSQVASKLPRAER